MNSRKQTRITATLTSFMLMSGSAKAALADVETMIAPQFTTAQLSEAHDNGVDLTKADFRPGLHIVPLADSWNTEVQTDAIRAQIAQQQDKGFYDTHAGDPVDLRSAISANLANQSTTIARHDRSFNSLEQVEPALKVTPISLGSSDLSAATLLEVRLSGGLIDGRWTGLTRTFDLPDLGIVVLNETDHAAGRESITLIKEWINIDIHGQPGSVRTARGASGHTLVTVGWANQRKIYSLRLQPHHPEQHGSNQARLVGIAKALAES